MDNFILENLDFNCKGFELWFERVHGRDHRVCVPSNLAFQAGVPRMQRNYFREGFRVPIKDESILIICSNCCICERRRISRFPHIPNFLIQTVSCRGNESVGRWALQSHLVNLQSLKILWWTATKNEKKFEKWMNSPLLIDWTIQRCCWIIHTVPILNSMRKRI